MRGVFITFEGCDGSGKSTQIKRVSGALRDRGIDVLVTREPGGTPFGEIVRSVLLDPNGPERTGLAEMLMYSAARAEIVSQVIRPALIQGRVVLSERFYDSTTVYQGYAGGIHIPDIEAINRISTGDLAPDLTFVLDLNDPQVFHARMRPKKKDKIESRSDEYHERVRQGYRDLALRYPERIHVIDASLTEDEVFQAVMSVISGFMDKARER
ncbi:MAG: dTMP kinase [Bacillota bacterium]|nr:dTMP kinase [Candidatus Fermentithermobacillaceae bacterium]